LGVVLGVILALLVALLLLWFVVGPAFMGPGADTGSNNNSPTINVNPPSGGGQGTNPGTNPGGGSGGGSGGNPGG
jgi:hypothetical protein